MMNLALMNRFFQNVDSEGRSPIAEQILSRWSIPGPVSHHRASENFAWSVGEPKPPSHFLRFNHATERAVHHLEGEIAFIRHLASSGIPVVTPVASQDGQYVETVDSELGPFHASVFTALHGSEPDAEELDLRALELWGQLVARVHSASEGFREGHRPYWSDILVGARELIPRENEVAHRELDDVEQRLSSYPIDDSLFGLIHFERPLHGWLSRNKEL